MHRQLLLIPQSALPTTGVFGRDLPLNHYRRYLGEERDELFYDASNGLRANALLALAATLRAGKALYLHLPECETDPDHARLLDYGTPLEHASPRFNARFRRLIAEQTTVAPFSLSQSALPPPFELDRPQIIVGKRGRGKSHYLADKLRFLRNHFPNDRVLIVLPYRHQSALSLAANETNTPCLPPDYALQQRPDARFLIIDEAAAIAPHQLKALCQHYPRYTLATTLDGYEGYGQQFQRHFVPTQEAVVQTFHHAYRYHADDTLETLLERTFLYQATPEPISTDAPVHFTHLEPKALCEDENLLRSVYALLNLAHYQTNPEDLKRLLDLPKQRLFIAQSASVVVGVLWAVEESALPEDLARAVMSGERRPQGRLLLQQLLIRRQNLNDNHTWLRISRLAVHPDWRRRGIAKQLVLHAKALCSLPLGVCYQSDNGSQNFWQAIGFKNISGQNRYNCLPSRIHCVQILNQT